MFLHLSLSHSVHKAGGGGLCPSMHNRSHDQGVSVHGEISVQGGISVQVESLSRRVSVQGFSVWRGSLSRRPPKQRPLTPYGNTWAVCILLECILVLGIGIPTYKCCLFRVTTILKYTD